MLTILPRYEDEAGVRVLFEIDVRHLFCLAGTQDHTIFLQISHEIGNYGSEFENNKGFCDFHYLVIVGNW